jgi:DUF4097 and DUF4098 domain-containing protein YvlB
MKFYLAIFMLGLFTWAAAGDYVETRNLKLPAEDLKKLEIDCAAGFLKVNGIPGLQEIQVEAEIVVKDMDDDRAQKELQRYLELSLEKYGQRATLISDFDHSAFSMSSILGKKTQVSINLTVKMPREMDLEVDDGSGAVEIQNITGDVLIDDGSGEIEIKNINGDVDIDDGSGELIIERIKGDVKIDDGSGELLVTEIEGSVFIDDGSGKITIDGIVGDVIIEDDGSGSVKIKNVKGKVVRKDD